MSWMVQQIERRGGEIRFRDYMELALYHPDHGYYSSGRPRYGRDGDFVTAPTSSRWYGLVLARWLGRVRRASGPTAFVDLASGDGSLVETLLDESAGLVEAGRFAAVISVERSASMRSLQRGRFAGADLPVVVRASLAAVESLEGATVFHASELFDALPVHRVVMRDGALREMTVRVEGGRLTWGETDAADPLARYFQDHGVVLQEGQTAEVNLESAPLLDGILRRCGESGLMVILDYGYPARRLYDPRGRRGGSLVAYRNHSVEPDLLRDPGAQDLTAHVNWDDLERVAESRGWGTVGRFPLAEFLIRAGLAEAMDREGLGEQAELDAATVAERQEIKRLLDPDGMGSDLKVLVIGRGTMARSAEETLTIDL